MAKRRRIASHHAVGASLDPKSMQQYIQDYYDEQGQRQGAQSTLEDTMLHDPFERQQIALKYAADKHGRTANLAERGLSSRGYQATDLVDIERNRIMAEEAQSLKVRTAQATFTATITNLNNRRTALDKSFAAEAGQNIQAGTGRYKHEKPTGWRPPALQGAATGAAAYSGSNPQPSAPTPTAAKPAAPARPTGARLSTTPGGAPRVLGLIHSAPRLTAGRARRTRLA